MNVSNIFKEVRDHLSMTQIDLSKVLGIHQTTISQIENGKCNPSMDVLVKLVKLARKHKLNSILNLLT